MENRSGHLIGIVSDTHGVIRPEAVESLKGVQLIIHAGDVGAPEVLDKLRSVAPVVAVRGNMDSGEWASELPKTEAVEFKGVSLYVLHDLSRLDLDPAAAGFSAVISGHTHMPAIEKLNGVFYLNPGSAGPRRFKLPATLALLRIKESVLSPEIIGLEI